MTEIPAWKVPSKSQPGTFRIVRRHPGKDIVDRWTCNCPGYHYRSKQQLNYACSHIRLVWQRLLQAYERTLKGF